MNPFAPRARRAPAPARLRGAVRFLVLVLVLAGQPAFESHAELAVEGLTDRSVHADRVTFRVPVPPEDTVLAWLDDLPVPTHVPIEVTAPDYHELRLERPAAPPAVPGETRLVRFIVRDTGRGESELGLPAWTPPPPVLASPAELEGATVRLLMPASFPLDLPLPMAVWLKAPDGSTWRAHAELRSSSHSPLLLLRGSGAGLIPSWPPSPASTASWLYSGSVASRTVERQVKGTQTSWQVVTQVPGGRTEWPAQSRVTLAGTLTIPVDATLVIGAGSVVRLEPGTDVLVLGQLLVEGTDESPVVFSPRSPDQPWGGFQVRGALASLVARAALFPHSGANPRWFDENPGYDVHRREQALFLVEDGARVTLTGCAAFDGHGQFGHGRNGFLTLDGCLVQRFLTGGEYNGGAVTIRGSSLVEFPRADAGFADADNDALYLTSGEHVIEDTVIGWAKDDGIDAGSGGAGSVLASNVWVEACFHEAFAWSGAGRRATNLACVALHCGQGIECGWSTGLDSPRVHAEHCLALGNLSGARFGDNYDWTYAGFLRVTNSFLLFNHRDVFGLTWDDWVWRTNQMDLRGTRISRVDPRTPGAIPWDPAADGFRLDAFRPTPGRARVGAGFAAWPTAPPPVDPPPLTIGLSTFAGEPVTVAYTIDGPATELARGRLTFSPGETLKPLPWPWSVAATNRPAIVRVSLAGTDTADVTGTPTVYLLGGPPGSTTTLVAAGSVWRYHDEGVDLGSAWVQPDYDDGSWGSGPAELGFGDGNEATVIRGGPSSARYPTVYFRRAFAVPDPSLFRDLEVRLRRDDGAVVHLNGTEVFRSNLPTGAISFATFSSGATSSETEFFTGRLSPITLRPGTNVLAVEVHQASAESSDLSFDLELVGRPPSRLNWARFAEDLVLDWNPLSEELQRAGSPTGPWQTVPQPSGQWVVPPGAPGFYRTQSRP